MPPGELPGVLPPCPSAIGDPGPSSMKAASTVSELRTGKLRKRCVGYRGELYQERRSEGWAGHHKRGGIAGTA